jgi:pimeloyl-ACP methyl ester carboxylesterase
MSMTSTSPAAVVSRDGTTIAYWMTGQGPALVLVHGTVSNHTTWDPVLPLLEAHRTLYAIDRRGRGASGDTADYDLSREFEDIAAVVDLAAETSGAGVDLLGHSFGGVCALGAARRTSHVRRLALYEGWFDPHPEIGAASDAVMDLIEQHLSVGDGDAALETFCRELVHMSDEELSAFRANAAWWQSRVEAAHTIVREDRAIRSAKLDPEEASELRIPVLLLVGTDSPDELRGDPEAVAQALPDARIEGLEGQQHLAHALAPDLFARRLLAFLDQPDA